MLGFEDVVRVTATPELVGELHDRRRTFHGHLSLLGFDADGTRQFSATFCHVYGETEKQCRIALQVAMTSSHAKERLAGAEVKPLRTYGLVAHPSR